MRCLISYDIVSNKRRQRVAKILLGYAYRVQRSVFEGIFSRKEFEECIEKLIDVIEKDEDSIRVYQLCDRCSKKIRISGTGKNIEEIDYIVI